MKKLPKYLQKNADELRAIRQDQPTPTYEEALRQVQRVEHREGDLEAPEHSVIDARLHKALSLCIKASDLGLVTIVSPKESSTRLGQAISDIRRDS